jgi:hypothetical protein
LESSRTAFRGGDCFHHFVRAFPVFAIADRHVGAFACQALRDRPSDSLIAARYGGHLTLQPI